MGFEEEEQGRSYIFEKLPHTPLSDWKYVHVYMDLGFGIIFQPQTAWPYHPTQNGQKILKKIKKKNAQKWPKLQNCQKLRHILWHVGEK